MYFMLLLCLTPATYIMMIVLEFYCYAHHKLSSHKTGTVRYIISKIIWYYFISTEIEDIWWTPFWMAYGVYGPYLIPGTETTLPCKGTSRIEMFVQPFYFMLFIIPSLILLLDFNAGIIASHFMLVYSDPENTTLYKRKLPTSNRYDFSPFDWI